MLELPKYRVEVRTAKSGWEVYALNSGKDRALMSYYTAMQDSRRRIKVKLMRRVKNGWLVIESFDPEQARRSAEEIRRNIRDERRAPKRP